MRRTQHRHDRPAHLAVRAVPALTLGGVVRLRLTCRNPGTQILHRAQLTGRGLCRADQRAELHGRRVPQAGGGGIGGHERLRQASLSRRQRAGGQSLAGYSARVHAADIRINHRGAQTKRKHANRRRSVGTHARQSQQRLVVGGNLAAVLLHNRHSGTVQTLCAARVTQPAPGAHRLRGGLGGKVSGGGPAAHPLLPHG